jgi:tripartite-type tricarboxylate transporter receptor subunit TctC
MPLLQRRHGLAVLAGALASPALPRARGAFAQGPLPDRPVRLVVPFAAGGTTDVLARIVAEAMAGPLGRQVVVDNKPGAGGSVGSAEVARADPDGSTVLAATVSTHAINPSLYARLPFDPTGDFAPVAHLLDVPNVAVAHPSLPAATVDELRAYAAANPPGTLNYASPGNGSVGHLQGYWLGRLIGAEMTHVPYRGAGPALQDLLAGRVQLMVDNLPTSLGHIRSGALRALLVSSERRVPQLPDAPSSPEAGLPEFIGYSWLALLAPRGTPPEAVEALAAAALAAVADPRARERLSELSATVVAEGPEATGRFVAAERARWAPIVKATGVTLG